jgi:enamine deaminase RidA (YjgF/YER057c/UK114 family)
METSTPVVPRGRVGILPLPVVIVAAPRFRAPGALALTAVAVRYRRRHGRATGKEGAAMATRRQLISSGGPFEARFGYSRAVRVGDHVIVSGTAAFKDGKPFAPRDAAAQTRHILEVIAQALAEAGATMSDVVRYRVFVTDIADYELVGAELGRVFGAIRPAGTMVGNSTLIHPDLVVEIEVDAIIDTATD